jgi:hypothetical protein
MKAVLLLLVAFPVAASPRKPLAELIVQKDPAWPLVKKAVADVKKRARILPTTRARGEATLVAVQFTTGSVIGAIALESGGLAVDHGWLRILGAGGPQMKLDLVSANGLDKRATPETPMLIIGVDVVGGVFALNGGAIPGQQNNVFYLAPDDLEWLDLKTGYSGFIQWALVGKLDDFYKTLRWPGWEKTVEALPLDQGLHVLPPLFAKADPKLPVSRKPVPIDELWRFTMDVARQKKAQNIKPGDSFQLKVTPK